jgi:predicted transcriptional regulator
MRESILISWVYVMYMAAGRLVLKKRGLGLSPLENDALKILWKKERGMRVREIHALLKKRRALTSVAVILDRLYQKGIVTRKIATARGGQYYIYYAKPREIVEKTIVEKSVNTLIEGFGKNAISYFQERFSKKR